MTITEEASDALEAKKSAELQLADAATCPPWRHAAFGALMGAIVTTPGLPLPWRFVVLFGVIASAGLIARSDRKRLGVFINGYRRGKTRLVIFPLLAIWAVIYWFSVDRGLLHRDHLTPLWLGLVAFVVGTLGSVIWQRVFVRELGA